MFSRRTATIVWGSSLVLVELLGGCANTMRDEQLARVAKDWSLVVRASQVIPVYPLTEDLMPGDMFLVRMSIPQQHREYQRRGFLPMDMHLTRLQGLEYSDLYLDSYGTRGMTNTPYHWLFPPDGMAPTEVEAHQVDTSKPPNEQGGGSGSRPRRHIDPTLWSSAPRAAFPSYTFQVDSQGGIQTALPIQGVPVALSMLQTDRAFGSVTLSDAYTYGVPYDRLIKSVSTWAAEPNNKEMLRKIRKAVSKGNTWATVLEDAGKFILRDHNERTVYLRVISRVYVVGSVTVALIDVRSGAGKAQAGATSSIQLLNPALQAPKTPQNAGQPADGTTPADKTTTGLAALTGDTKTEASNFQTALKTVTDNLGGAVELRWATARSVALDETFPRPLVIGYLGFDFPVNNDGSLGTPVATQYQLERASGTLKDSPTAPKQRDQITRWLAQDHKNNAKKLTDWLRYRGIAMPADMWVQSEAASPGDLDDAICELNIPEPVPAASRKR